ncbi:MAG: 50S ribosomal protein L4 [Candidatus Caenarcaniphilales bacterium]|nr:50S ribosomal protein L4 [Candidatus Caenarcaniphilales bacterium]
MKFQVVNQMNKPVGELDISEDVILASPNEGLVHQLLLLQHTRAMRNANTKTKSEVRGGGAKPWKQKGTGRARVGSIRSPLWRGGGVTFGPQFHEISIDMPRRARLKALCSALSFKKDHLIVIDKFPLLSQPKTKEVAILLNTLKSSDTKALIIFDQSEVENLPFYHSLSNLPGVKAIHWQNLNVHDLLNAKKIIIDQGSFKNIESWLLMYKLSKSNHLKEVVAA